MNEVMHHLRIEAEKLLNEKKTGSGRAAENDLERIVHDLKVYQIELELQNEELRSTQKRLEDTNRRFAQLYNQAPVGYVTLSKTSGIEQANQTFCEMVNRDLAQVLHMSFSDFLHPEDRSIFLSRFNAFFKQPGEKNMVLKIANNRGEYFYARVTGNLQGSSLMTAADETGEMQLFLIVQNITEQKNAEDLLGQARVNYEAFFNTIDELLFVLDNEGGILQINSSVINRLGYSREELLGKSVLMVHPVERREEAGRIVMEMLRGETAFCPVPLVAKSGVQIPVETRVTKGMWDGKPVIFGVTKDISQIKLSEEKFSKVFYLNPSACGLSDLNTGQYVEVNEAFYRLLGYTNEEVIGKTASELGIISKEEIQQVLQKAGNTEKVMNVDAKLRAKDGTIKHVFLSAENIYIQEKKLRYTVVHDITEKKIAEDEIHRKNRQLTEVNAEKDRFLSIVAHDLRSPFHGFMGMTELLANKAADFSIEDLSHLGKMLHDSSKNIYNLLENLLQWSRVQRGNIEFHPENVYLEKLIKDSIRSIAMKAAHKEITVHTRAIEEFAINVDKNMINSVLRNLLSNAVKFTPRGGEIHITARALEGGFTEVAIKDTGVGIAKENMAGLFSLTAHMGTLGTENEPSSGLGLILCKEFVEKHGGKIWVESAKGIGSTFFFTLQSVG